MCLWSLVLHIISSLTSTNLIHSSCRWLLEHSLLRCLSGVSSFSWWVSIFHLEVVSSILYNTFRKFLKLARWVILGHLHLVSLLTKDWRFDLLLHRWWDEIHVKIDYCVWHVRNVVIIITPLVNTRFKTTNSTLPSVRLIARCGILSWDVMISSLLRIDTLVQQVSTTQWYWQTQLIDLEVMSLLIMFVMAFRLCLNGSMSMAVN